MSQILTPQLTPKEVSREEIALLAYTFWQQRGCPDGTDHEDWYRAESELRTRFESEQPESYSSVAA